MEIIVDTQFLPDKESFFPTWTKDEKLSINLTCIMILNVWIIKNIYIQTVNKSFSYINSPKGNVRESRYSNIICK